MRTIKLIIMSVCILTAINSACFGSTSSWTCLLMTTCNCQMAKNTAGLFGVSKSASDINDSSDRATATGYDLYAATYHDCSTEPTWDGPTGFFDTDMRSPIGAGQSKTWTIYVWAAPSLPSDASFVGIDFGYNIGTLPTDISFTLALRAKPVGVTGGPATGTVWDLSRQPYGVNLPVYRTSNGLDGYVFDFTATAIPEPSSLLALLAGVTGIGGVAWRRTVRSMKPHR